MYRIAKRFKSLAEGELPLDDISEWKVNENDPVDHFLFQSENSFGRKDIIKMKGLKRNPFKYCPKQILANSARHDASRDQSYEHFV